MSVFHNKNQEKHFFAFFLTKYLVGSKKSSTFAPAFEKKASVLSLLRQ